MPCDVIIVVTDVINLQGKEVLLIFLETNMLVLAVSAVRWNIKLNAFHNITFHSLGKLDKCSVLIVLGEHESSL